MRLIYSPNSRTVSDVGGWETVIVNENAAAGAICGVWSGSIPDGSSRRGRWLNKTGVCMLRWCIRLGSSLSRTNLCSRSTDRVSATKNRVNEYGPGDGVLPLSGAAASKDKRPSCPLFAASVAKQQSKMRSTSARASCNVGWRRNQLASGPPEPFLRKHS